jgi:hypothetical protein
MLLRHAITDVCILDRAFKRAISTALALHARCSEWREARALTGGCSTKMYTAPALDSPETLMQSWKGACRTQPKYQFARELVCIPRAGMRKADQVERWLHPSLVLVLEAEVFIQLGGTLQHPPCHLPAAAGIMNIKERKCEQWIGHYMQVQARCLPLSGIPERIAQATRWRHAERRQRPHCTFMQAAQRYAKLRQRPYRVGQFMLGTTRSVAAYRC